MPKVTDTRKQRAQELLQRLVDGPAIFSSCDITRTAWNAGFKDCDEATIAKFEKMGEELYSHYQMWVRSWVEQQLILLIPELKKQRQLEQAAERAKQAGQEAAT